MTPAETKALDPDMPAEELRLHMGELTSSEVLAARAAIRWANSVRAETKAPLPDGLIVLNIVQERLEKEGALTCIEAHDFDTIRAHIAAQAEKIAKLEADNKRLREAVEDGINHLQHAYYNLAFEVLDNALAQTED